MAVYQLGSHGPEVEAIQRKLKEAGFYRGPVDGDFGGGTYSAVKAFQAARKLEADGKVGPTTWKALMQAPIAKPAIWSKPLDYKCLALTGSIETGKGVPECFAAVAGDFDGQGLSFGACQWNFGQKTLQPMLSEMYRNHSGLMLEIFQEKTRILFEILQSPWEEQMDSVRGIMLDPAGRVIQPWKGMFSTLGRTAEFQDIQRKAASSLFKQALALCKDFDLWSERAVALLFDIKVQNGSIGAKTLDKIQADFDALAAGLSKNDTEVSRMRIVANRRAEAANPRWVEDVRKRKLAIAEGRGEVHGLKLDLEEQYGIRLVKSA